MRQLRQGFADDIENCLRMSGNLVPDHLPRHFQCQRQELIGDLLLEFGERAFEFVGDPP